MVQAGFLVDEHLALECMGSICVRHVAFPGLFNLVVFGCLCSPKFVKKSEVTKILWKDLARGFMWVCHQALLCDLPSISEDL